MSNNYQFFVNGQPLLDNQTIYFGDTVKVKMSDTLQECENKMKIALLGQLRYEHVMRIEQEVATGDQYGTRFVSRAFDTHKQAFQAGLEYSQGRSIEYSITKPEDFKSILTIGRGGETAGRTKLYAKWRICYMPYSINQNEEVDISLDIKENTYRVKIPEYERTFDKTVLFRNVLIPESGGAAAHLDTENEYTLQQMIDNGYYAVTNQRNSGSDSVIETQCKITVENIQKQVTIGGVAMQYGTTPSVCCRRLTITAPGGNFTFENAPVEGEAGENKTYTTGWFTLQGRGAIIVKLQDYYKERSFGITDWYHLSDHTDAEYIGAPQIEGAVYVNHHEVAPIQWKNDAGIVLNRNVDGVITCEPFSYGAGNTVLGIDQFSAISAVIQTKTEGQAEFVPAGGAAMTTADGMCSGSVGNTSSGHADYRDPSKAYWVKIRITDSYGQESTITLLAAAISEEKPTIWEASCNQDGTGKQFSMFWPVQFTGGIKAIPIEVQGSEGRRRIYLSSLNTPGFYIHLSNQPGTAYYGGTTESDSITYSGNIAVIVIGEMYESVVGGTMAMQIIFTSTGMYKRRLLKQGKYWESFSF